MKTDMPSVDEYGGRQTTLQLPTRSRVRALRSVVAAAGVLVAASGGIGLPATLRSAPPEPRAPEATQAPMEAPEPSPAVAASLGAGFVTPEEAKTLRVFHGLATADDLDTPARRASWALSRGAYLDPALLDHAAPALDRAAALVARGETDAALALLEHDGSMRATRLRVWAYAQQGRADMVAACVEPALALLRDGKGESAADIAEAARAAAIASRWVAGAGEPGALHKSLMAALKRAREQLDRLHWPVMLAEAEILYEKDNSAQAQQALEQVLALNPACAEAWALLGRMAVDAFDMASAEAIGARLDLLAGATASPAPDAAPGDAPDAAPAAPAAPPALAAPSPLAAVVRIRAMLRQNDPDLAEELSAGARRAYPAHAELAALAVAIEALRFDPAALDAKLKAYSQRAPGSAQALFEAGRALSEARQYGPAADLLKRASARQPAWARPLTDLGLLYVQSGQDEDAGEALRAATALDPFNVRADNSLKLVNELATYRRVESEHFVVRFKGAEGAAAGPSADSILAREMLPVLEENHRRVTGAPEAVPGGLDFSPPGRTIVELMPNHRWFAVRIAGMPRIHTIAAATGPIIAMEAPRDGASHSGTYDWPRVLRHEYTHTVGLARTGNRLPHWFTEAQSVYLEHSPRDYPTCELLARTVERGDLFDFVAINQAFVRPKRPTDRQLAYAQGHWMYEFLVETFGPRAPLRLMDEYARGVREEEAYQKILGISRDEFMTRFKPWAETQLVAWGLRTPPGMPSIKALRAQLEERGETDVTPEVVQRWLAEHPRHPDVLDLAVRQALSANANTPTVEMVPMLERLAEARPVDPLPHKTLARLYLSLPPTAPTEGRPSQRDAIPHLEWLDAREDRSPTFADQLAALYVGERDLDRAKAKADRAVRIAPYDARFRERAAAVALLRQDLDAARAQIEAMIVLEPDRPVHRQRLEALRAKMGR